MVLVDAKLEFCNATALSTGGASALLGNVIDLGANGIRDIGAGAPVYLVIAVSTTITMAAGGTLQFQLWQGTGTDGTDINAGAEALMASHAYTEAELEGTGGETVIQGSKGSILWCCSLPVQGDAYKRYLQIRQIYGTAAVTAGAINAYLTLTPPVWRAVADALTV